MKQFINKIFLFLFPVLLSALLMEIALRRIPNDYLLKKQYLDQHAHETEILILGSSHTFYGMNPDYFSRKTFNSANVSQSLNYDWAILEKYENQLPELRAVILPISYFTLYGNLNSGREAWRAKNYNIYSGIHLKMGIRDFSELLSFSFSENIHRIESYYILKKNNISCSELGWGNEYKSEKSRDLEKTGVAASKRHTRDNLWSDMNKRRYNDNIGYINKIINSCHRKGARVLLFTPPAYTTYSSNLNLDQLQLTVNTVEQIANTNENCDYINLLESPEFISEDFYDADHLNEVGAKKLSMMLNERIQSLKDYNIQEVFLKKLIDERKRSTYSTTRRE